MNLTPEQVKQVVDALEEATTHAHSLRQQQARRNAIALLRSAGDGQQPVGKMTLKECFGASIKFNQGFILLEGQTFDLYLTAAGQKENEG